MKKILLTLFMIAVSFNSQAKDGFITLDSPIQINSDKKVQVIEYFWYGCPHCNSLEPAIKLWKSNLPDNVEFIKKPMAFNKVWSRHAQIYEAAKKLNINVDSDVFHAIHVEKKKMIHSYQIFSIFNKHGIDRDKFNETFNVFNSEDNIKKTKKIAAQYKLKSVPAFSINGKYVITSKSAGSEANIFKVMDELIKNKLK